MGASQLLSRSSAGQSLASSIRASVVGLQGNLTTSIEEESVPEHEDIAGCGEEARLDRVGMPVSPAFYSGGRGIKSPRSSSTSLKVGGQSRLHKTFSQNRQKMENGVLANFMSTRHRLEPSERRGPQL